MNLVFPRVIVIPQANRSVQFASWGWVIPAHGGMTVADIALVYASDQLLLRIAASTFILKVKEYGYSECRKLFRPWSWYTDDQYL